MKYRSTAVLSALGVAALLTALPLAAVAKGAVHIQAVEVRGTGTAREVVIRASRAPTFSVFRLTEPFRILVDIDDAQLAEPGLTKVDDGMIRYIATNQFEDEASSVLRIEIALDEREDYAVETEDNAIVVRLGHRGPSKGTPARAGRSESASSSQGARRATPTRRPVQVGRWSRRIRAGRALLTARVRQGDASRVKAKISTLDTPRRLVIDLAGVTTRPRYARLRVGRHGVKLARIADKETGVRLVLDLVRNGPLPRVHVDAVSGRLEVAIDRPAPRAPAVARADTALPRKKAKRPNPKPARAEPQPTPVLADATRPVPVRVAAPTAAPARNTPAPKAPRAGSPATPPDGPALTRVRDVRFEEKDGFVRLTVELSRPGVSVEKGSTGATNAPVLRVANTRIPGSLERTLDVSAVARGVLSAISTYADGTTLIIAAQLLPGTEHRHWQKGNRLMWDFRNIHASAPKVPTYAEESTSGFLGTTADTSIGKLRSQRRRYKGRRISLDLKDAEIQNVLRLLADVSKLNIVAAEDVQGKVTIKLRNVPWDQALDIILRAKGLDKTRNGNIIRVAPIEVLRKEEELRIERDKARIELEPLTVRLIPVSYAVAAEVKPQVEALLSPRGKVNIDVRTNVLVVEDIAEVLLKAERLVRTLDTQTPQVLIESRIVEARSNFSREIGIQWGGNINATQQFGNSTGLTFPNNIRISGGSDDQQTVTEGVNVNPNYAINLPAPSVGSGGGGSLGFVFGSLGGSALINLRLSAAESTGKVKIISAPKVVTLDNKEAKIISGEKVPITVVTANGPTTRFIDANLELNVTPHVTQDGSILLKINAKKNELSNRVDLLGVPGIITKEADTEMIVRDGDTAVLGGIYRRTAQENENYVPWLGRIPVLGWLFKRTARTDARDELLIFISPRIVNRSAALVQPS